MTSNEKRREGRYKRRRAAREARKKKLYAGCDDYENLISYRALFNANQKSKRGVSWKASVQRYQMNLLKNLERTQAALERGQDITKGFVEFDTMERGKLRHIRSIHFSERIVQRAVCDNALVPMLRRSLIYDNGACLPGKGIDQSLERLETHLKRFYRANGFSNDGWAVLFDFSGFFDSILHEICFRIYRKTFTDEKILWLLTTFVKPFGCPNIGRRNQHIRRKNNMEEYTGKSLGLGSQISQITAVAYPNAIDHYIKERLKVRFYGRYMDDGYMLFRSKESARKAIEALKRICPTLGIKLNEKKTHIAKLKHGIRFLKVKLTLTATGKVKRRMTRKSITRQRRKLKKFAAYVAAGEMTVEEATNSYASWKGHAIRRGGRMAAKKLDALFEELFGVPAPECRIKKKKRRKFKWKPARKCRAYQSTRKSRQLLTRHTALTTRSPCSGKKTPSRKNGQHSMPLPKK